jgi:endonuclease/exonuclease/phosphatase family metal-dependent hydrolase
MGALRIMTFNLRRDLPADGAQRWSARRDLVADVVREHAPDILGTQEGLAHQLADLDERLPGYARVGGCRAGTGEDEACVIFFATARLRALAWGDLWLSDTPSVPGSATWGNRHPRIVTWARFRDLRSGREFTAANTHLDHESEVARRKAAEFLAARMPGAILMGDLNAEPGEPTHSILLGAGWDDAAAREPTFHAFTGQARARLDHVLAPRTHRVRRHRVISHARDGVHASDHHPILVEIEPDE